MYKSIKEYDELAYYVIMLLDRHGMRVSEVLDIEINDRIKQDLFLVKAKKNGQNFKISIQEWERILNLSNGTKGYLFGSLSRFKIYRVCKKFNIFVQKEDNINRAVTHSFRHNFAKDIHGKYKDENVTKDMLNHKSKSAQKFYLKK